jgi:exodeoxyribonuclease VII large subunit
MSDAVDLAPGGNVPVYSVSELGAAVKRTLEGNFERIRVRGEVSQPNYHSSGHLYLKLKDEGAVLEAVCWKGAIRQLGLKVEHGMEVIVTGKISSYPGSSKYQIVIESIELAGVGALLKLLEERKKKLAAEGLFDESRKKPLPRLPGVIGVVTSPTGAVIRDILHRLADRFPRHVLIWPVPVQGEGAAEKIAAAIRGFNSLVSGGPVPRPDLLIVARGGGSLEDLMPFNEEVVVRAAAASAIPLIAAVGHETDVTLIDFAADRRAPTPTAAAEMAVPVRAELLVDTLDTARRLFDTLRRSLAEQRRRVADLARGLADPARLAADKAQTLDLWSERLANARRPYLESRHKLVQGLGVALPTPREQVARRRAELGHAGEILVAALRQAALAKAHALDRAADGLRPEILRRRVEQWRERLSALARLLDGLDYQAVLRRGFVLVRDGAGAPVTAAAGVSPGASLDLQFADGHVGVTAKGHQPPAPAGKPAKVPAGGTQGTLL